MVHLRIRHKLFGSEPGRCAYCDAEGIRFELGWIPSLHPKGECSQCGKLSVFERSFQRRYARACGLLTFLAVVLIAAGVLLGATTGVPALRLVTIVAALFWWWWSIRGLQKRFMAQALLSEQEDPLVDALYEAVRNHVISDGER